MSRLALALGNALRESWGEVVAASGVQLNAESADRIRAAITEAGRCRRMAALAEAEAADADRIRIGCVLGAATIPLSSDNTPIKLPVVIGNTADARDLLPKMDGSRAVLVAPLRTDDNPDQLTLGDAAE
jgi:hypothetical protein